MKLMRMISSSALSLAFAGAALITIPVMSSDAHASVNNTQAQTPTMEQGAMGDGENAWRPWPGPRRPHPRPWPGPRRPWPRPWPGPRW